MKKTFEQLLACATRELGMRERIYPKWIALGKMSAEKAEHEIECMRDICKQIEKLKILKEASDEMKKSG